MAVVSAILRFVNEAVGGKYMFTMFNLLLFGSFTFVNMLYSFPDTYSILS